MENKLTAQPGVGGGGGGGGRVSEDEQISGRLDTGRVLEWKIGIEEEFKSGDHYRRAKE